jgi:outer membrane protein OmpA-like peptidoglycan-associated protein
MRLILSSTAVVATVVATLALAPKTFAQTAPSASPKSDYNVEDVVKGFAQKPPPGTADQCNPDADGVCQPSKDSRGFSLEDSSGPAPPVGAKPKATSPSRTQVATAGHHHQRAPIGATAPVSRHDLLISFRTGSSELTDRSKSNARVFVEAMKRPELSGAIFEIGGHTDASGSPDRNRILAKERADAVRQFMIEQGADPDHLKAVGYGSDQPTDSKHPEAAVNRRVEARRLS